MLLAFPSGSSVSESESTSTSDQVSLQSISDKSSVNQPLRSPSVKINDEMLLSSLVPSSLLSKGSMKKAASLSESGTAALAPAVEDPSFFGLGHLYFKCPGSLQFQQTPLGFRSLFGLSETVSASSFLPSFSCRRGLGQAAHCERWRSTSSVINEMRASGVIVFVGAYSFATASWLDAKLASQ